MVVLEETGEDERRMADLNLLWREILHLREEVTKLRKVVEFEREKNRTLANRYTGYREGVIDVRDHLETEELRGFNLLNQDEFLVVSIEGSKGTGQATRFHVRWADGTTTWEPRSNIRCPELIREFQLREARKRAEVRRARERERLLHQDPERLVRTQRRARAQRAKARATNNNQ